jgi:membrane associated rhomboid family serine protease
MIPISDDNPTIYRTYTTWIIIGLNVLAWVFLQGMGARGALVKSVSTFGLIPGEIMGEIPPGTLIHLGGRYVCEVGTGLGWPTVVTSIFMHGSWMHIIANMWFLKIFGDNIEEVMGPVRFAIFYMICGIAAGAAQIVSNPASPIPIVGASGAIGGVMGAYALLFPRTRVRMLVFLGIIVTTMSVPAFLMLGYWFGLQVLTGLAGSASGVAVWAHAGGFALGLVLARPFCNRERLELCRPRRGEYY